ncbi:hypothetical protein HY375_00675 [Candidatus Berkelbacteria bacterium]|nr:hypothetical protein [Candidatus Berkelbacteria bacterium]
MPKTKSKSKTQPKPQTYVTGSLNDMPPAYRNTYSRLSACLKQELEAVLDEAQTQPIAVTHSVLQGALRALTQYSGVLVQNLHGLGADPVLLQTSVTDGLNQGARSVSAPPTPQVQPGAATLAPDKTAEPLAGSVSASAPLSEVRSRVHAIYQQLCVLLPATGRDPAQQILECAVQACAMEEVIRQRFQTLTEAGVDEDYMEALMSQTRALVFGASDSAPAPALDCKDLN